MTDDPEAGSERRALLDIEAILDCPAASPGAAPTCETIGSSREGRPVLAHSFGSGSRHVSLIGGCHADEPVGPWTLRRLVGFLAGLPEESKLLRDWTWSIVPHANPDGEIRNLGWSGGPEDERPTGGFDFEAWHRGRTRELPGDDVEFGFPRDASDTGARPENRAVAAWLEARAAVDGPIRVHGSFHGMGIATGPWFLIDRAWVDRTATLRERLAREVRDLGYTLHDVDRGGEKGFDRIGVGFCTRPDSRSMQRHFLELGDSETAERFRPSSMELARRLGEDALTFVTEMPLFLGNREARSANPRQVEALPPMPIRDQTRLQLRFLEEALRAVLAAP